MRDSSPGVGALGVKSERCISTGGVVDMILSDADGSDCCHDEAAESDETSVFGAGRWAAFNCA